MSLNYKHPAQEYKSLFSKEDDQDDEDYPPNFHTSLMQEQKCMQIFNLNKKISKYISYFLFFYLLLIFQ
jgi:hypothetical protein